MFKEVDPKQSFPKMEEALIKFWKENKTFEKSVEKGEKEYVFYDGPPFATGLPHYGHLLAGTLKDVVPRYWTMQGYKIERKWGWDCHGLPIENLIEKDLGLKDKKDLEAYGVDKFNEACRASVLKYAEEWKKTVTRMGRWVDMENDYKTMDLSYMESIWWVFKSLHEKGLVYEGKKPMHICPRCVTPLSNFEVTLGYQDISDGATTAQFKLKETDQKVRLFGEDPTYILAWTTTTWTLPGNLALAVGKDIEYTEVELEGKKVVLAKECLETVRQLGDFEEEDFKPSSESFMGSQLVDLKYEPLFDTYKNIDLPGIEKGWKVMLGEFVTTEAGTGVVHIASGYGEDDMILATENQMPILQHVKMEGTFIPEMGAEFEKHTVVGHENKAKSDQFIAEKLKEKDYLFAFKKFKHSYPHCWRCDSPLLNYATSAWFVAVTKIKEGMLDTNQQIHWHPNHVKDGRFGKWLENAKDWAVSRTRYWGTPIPIWRNTEDPEDLMVVGSVEELEALSGTKADDLHKHKIDHIEIQKDGKTYRRIPEVFDCWFESGSMPYAQLHYPFENKEKFENNFPANFIAEGLDQTRGWFYTLHVLANALFEKPAFQNIIVNGIVLAENGQKMSKRLKNYPDPNEVLNKYGADALRFYMLNSQAVSAGDMRFAEHGVEQVLKNMMLPIWNAYSFFVTYATIDKWEPGKATKNSPNKLDTWIIAELNQLIAGQIEYFNVYDLQKASNSIYKFVDDLTNWYIRRSRRRFWKSEDDSDKNHAYSTLYTVLTKLSQVLAPFTPFMPEAIYQNLTGEESVHLTQYPEPDSNVYDETLIHEVHLAKTIVSLGLAARAKQKIKVRQPLQKIDVVLADAAERALLVDQIDTIKEELNIKEINFIDDPSSFATKIAKPNAKILGPKYGKEVQQIIQAAKAGVFEELPNGNIKVMKYELTPDELTIDYIPKGDFDVESAEGILIALDTELTPELEQEGLARDLVRQIQDLRKKAGYNVSDRITISLEGAPSELIQKFGKTIQEETLAVSIESVLPNADAETTFEGIKISVKKQ